MFRFSVSVSPFWLHIFIESPACLNFFLNPDQQLGSPAPQAHAIIRQFAILLLVSNLIAFICTRRPIDDTSKNVAAALAVYHLAPCIRAAFRIAAGETAVTSGLGGPLLHLVVHGICFGTLMEFYLKDSLRASEDHSHHT